jgi:hypothetical protein
MFTLKGSVQRELRGTGMRLKMVWVAGDERSLYFFILAPSSNKNVTICAKLK